MLKNVKLLLSCLTSLCLLSCTSSEQKSLTSVEEGLFKVSILYPDGEGKTFDMDYYQKKHMPMVAGHLGDNLVFYEIDKGVGGRTANDKAPYVAVGYFFVKDVAQYNAAIGKNREAIINDIKNYTNIQPVIQISEVSVVHAKQ